MSRVWREFAVYCNDPAHDERVDFPVFHIAPRSRPLTHRGLTYSWQLLEAGIGSAADLHPCMHRIDPGDFPDADRRVIEDARRRVAPPGSTSRGRRRSGLGIATRYLAILDCGPLHGARFERRADQLGEDLGWLVERQLTEAPLSALEKVQRIRNEATRTE